MPVLHVTPLSDGQQLLPHAEWDGPATVLGANTASGSINSHRSFTSDAGVLAQYTPEGRGRSLARLPEEPRALRPPMLGATPPAPGRPAEAGRGPRAERWPVEGGGALDWTKECASAPLLVDAAMRPSAGCADRGRAAQGPGRRPEAVEVASRELPLWL